MLVCLYAVLAAQEPIAYNGCTRSQNGLPGCHITHKLAVIHIMFGKTLLEDHEFLHTRLQRPWLMIENALTPEFAEELYEDLLSTEAWAAEDKSGFSPVDQVRLDKEYSFTRGGFRMEALEAPDSVHRLHAYLNSDEILSWISSISGRLCNGFSGSCARYLGSNHLTSHNDYYVTRLDDQSVTSRTVTFNYYLTRNWDTQWGGNFVWENPHAVIAPVFNALVMFLVSHHSDHHVELVSNAATEPRLAITGWFTTSRKAGDRKLNIRRT